MLGKQQLLSILCFIILFLLLYLGCDTKSKSHKVVEKSRADKVEAISIQKLIKESKESLMIEEKTSIDFIHAELNKASDSLKVKYLEQLSSEWYRFGHPIIAGYYAEKIAEVADTEDSWSIAGTTFSIGMNKSKDENQATYTFEKAVNAFERAISLNPDNIDHHINLALCYTTRPPKDNPMKGVLMMVDLNKKNPNNVKVLGQLARLSLKTNQIDKAISRYEQILAVDPENNNAHCMLAQVLTSNNRAAEAQEHIAKCK